MRARRHFWVPSLLRGGIVLLTCLTLNAFAQGNRDEVRLVHADGAGNVELMQAGSTRWVPIREGAVLKPLDRLRIGPNTRAALEWSDKSVVTLKPRSEIEILPPHQPRGLFGMQVLRGVMSFFHREQPGRIRVIARGASAGIDGTEFVFSVEGINGVEQVTLSVIDGIVTFSNEVDTLTLTAGQQAVAQPGVAPRRTAGFVVNTLLQWAFYYPGVLDLPDLPLTADEKVALASSIEAYRSGDLQSALEQFGARAAGSDAELIYHAALLLSVGEVDRVSGMLDRVPRGETGLSQLVDALRQLIAAVQYAESAPARSPQLATELLASSYYQQSRGGGDEALRSALDLAQRAAEVSPNFGFAWVRVAELEFSFGRNDRALAALDKGLAASPKNAQGLALKGFLLAANNKPREGIEWFEKALAVDSSLGNAWLGRGLCRIKRGDLAAGREDLLVAAALEPRRAQLRSYLGKAYGDAGQSELALHELELARRMDTNDPTSLLYSALIKAEQNRINEAIDDLEKSQELNDNRNVYRSSLLLDQDRAARSANLAHIYADAGLSEVAVREASRSVAFDYANYSSHLFLANSYNEIRKNSVYNQRFETPVESEYLVAALLGPAYGFIFAQGVSQNEYGQLFDRNRLGVVSETEYLSHGAWNQAGVQYGTIGNSSYALTGGYQWDPGQSRNQELETRFLSARFKQQITPSDSVYLEIQDAWIQSGDLPQRAIASTSIQNVETRGEQSPNVLAGWNHQWSEAHRTLLLAARIDDVLTHENPHGRTYLMAVEDGVLEGVVETDLAQNFRNRATVYSFDLQHIFARRPLESIAGVRAGYVENDVFNRQVIFAGNAAELEGYFGPAGTVQANQDVDVSSFRLSPYFYQHWRIFQSLLVIGGVSYDYQELADNVRFAPVSDHRNQMDQFSPKGAIVWTPSGRFTVRAAYSQSLVSMIDSSIRLEPTQLAGFVQAYRTLFPTSLVGGIAGARLETVDLSIEHRFPTRTYIAAAGQFLASEAEHPVGAFRHNSIAQGDTHQLEQRLRYEELAFETSAHQLLGKYLALGINYRISDVNLYENFPSLAPPHDQTTKRSGVLQRVTANASLRHHTGLFANVNADWWSQNATVSDTFWQLNVASGYRFPRNRAEITIGILNVLDEDYRLDPINLYPGITREATFFARLTLNF